MSRRYGKGCEILNESGVYTHVSMYINWIDISIKKLKGYTIKSFDESNNIFFNCAHNSQNNFFIIFYLIMIRLNKYFFYL
jgi:secreted trypsin-like serine protease